MEKVGDRRMRERERHRRLEEKEQGDAFALVVLLKECVRLERNVVSETKLPLFASFNDIHTRTCSHT